MEASCQVLIQLLPPDTEAVSLNTEMAAYVATIVAATPLLASNNIKVCLRLEANTVRAIPAGDVLYELAPMIQQFDCCPADADSTSSHGLTDSHIRGLVHGSNCITSLSLCWSPSHPSSLHLLASFGNLQHLELQLEEPDGLQHLSGLKGLVELHLTIKDARRPDSSCEVVLESNKDSLLHVSLSAGTWDVMTYRELSNLCELRTFSLTVCGLQRSDAAVLAQLRPSQSMSISIHKTVDHEVDAETVSSMQNLTSLTLIGLDLRSIDVWPQSTLEVLTLRKVVLRSNQLRQMVQSSPSVKQLNLHELQGLRLDDDTVCTILQLRYLTKLCLSGNILDGVTAARVSWLEAFGRAQQSVGMAQPKMHVTYAMPHQTMDFCVDYTRYPALCGAEFDERRATHTQRCWAKVAYPGVRMGESFVSTLQGASAVLLNFPGRAISYARDLAGSRTWVQVESKHPLGCLVAVAMVGINVACLSNRPGPALPGHASFLPIQSEFLETSSTVDDYAYSFS